MQWIDCEKNYCIFFLGINYINDRFNVYSTISYYNVKHIKDSIYEAKANDNYFRLVTLKTVHLNNREFRHYDIAGTLDKQYVLAGHHGFVRSGQRIIVFKLHISQQYWIRQHQVVIRHRLKQELISILWYCCNKCFIYFLLFFYFIYFYLVNISYPVTCLKLFNTLSHQRSWKMNMVWIM